MNSCAAMINHTMIFTITIKLDPQLAVAMTQAVSVAAEIWELSCCRMCTITYVGLTIGIEAGPAGPALAGPLFQQINEFISTNFINEVCTCALALPVS